MRSKKLAGVLVTFLAGAVLLPGAAKAQDDGPDGEVVALLQQLIQTNTSNPPGNEAQIAELLKTRLAPLGFEIDIVPTPTAGKAHFIARLRAGTRPRSRSCWPATRTSWASSATSGRSTRSRA